jgi:hypothetical protein
LTFYLLVAVLPACFGLSKIEARFTPVATNPPSITLRYDGALRDRVGQNNLTTNPDGQLDGTFTVTLSAGSGHRTVTQLVLVNSAGGVWDTDGSDAFWTLGVASGMDAALANSSTDVVSLAVEDGGEFKIFGADYENRMFVAGTPFTLFADFSDGSSATASLTIALTGPPVVTLAATMPAAYEGGTGGAFTVTRTGSTASALNVNYTVGGTAVAGTHFAALSGSAVIAAGSSTGTIVIAPVENSLADGDKTVVVALSSDASYIVGSPSIATVTVHDNEAANGPAAITVRFDGIIRDRVGQNDLARNSDGQLDSAFTVTLNAGSGNRTVTQLRLTNSLGNEWNTQGGDGLWTLGAASGWDAPLVNGNNDSVNFPVSDGGEFKVFGADYQNRLFLPGSAFTLTVLFADGSSATDNVTTGTTGPAAITVRFDGIIRDRVGQNDLARNPDGQLDATFTVTLNAGSGNRTVTHLRLTNTAGNEWNTEGGDGLWTLGAATGWDAALVNGNNDSVNFPVSDGGEFKIFGADYQNRLFLPGSAFTLTVGFSDGSTVTGNVSTAQTAPAAVTLDATTPTALEGGAGGVFTLARTGSKSSALTVNYTVGGTAVAGTHYAALNGSAVIAAGSLTGTIAVVPVENSLADGDKTVVLALSADATYIVGSPSTATVTVHDNDGPNGPAAIAMRFDGSIRDRVGRNNLSAKPDGQLDGTFAVTLNAGSGNRTVTQLLLANSAGGGWNTDGADGLYTLGAATGWDAVLVNGNNDDVNFPVADGGEFKIFASDFQNRMFVSGTGFT